MASAQSTLRLFFFTRKQINDDSKLIWCTSSRDNKIQWLFSSQGLAQSQQTRTHTYTDMHKSSPKIPFPYTVSEILDIILWKLHFCIRKI